jgi:hypothetical protein
MTTERMKRSHKTSLWSSIIVTVMVILTTCLGVVCAFGK